MKADQVQMAAYLDGFDWQGKLAEMRALYERRCDALVAALEASMPDGVTWQRPRGSFYLWVRLPEGIDSDELLDAAIARGVVFVPGTAFYVDGQGNDTMRLSYCLPTEEQLTEAGTVLGQLVTEMASRSR